VGNCPGRPGLDDATYTQTTNGWVPAKDCGLANQASGWPVAAGWKSNLNGRHRDTLNESRVPANQADTKGRTNLTVGIATMTVKRQTKLSARNAAPGTTTANQPTELTGGNQMLAGNPS
jgi:hypothetical protein